MSAYNPGPHLDPEPIVLSGPHGLAFLLYLRKPPVIETPPRLLDDDPLGPWQQLATDGKDSTHAPF
jgi:hypothetical protein